MIDYSEALRRVLAATHRLPAASLPLGDATGRFLAESVSSTIDSPPFDNTAVDGFALCGQGPYRILGAIPAGTVSQRGLTDGEAMQIFTGAPVPAGTQSIAMIEDCRVEDKTLYVSASGPHVRKRGEDIKLGDTIAEPGDFLTPALIGLLASVGTESVRVGGQPRVAILTTGDEIVGRGPLSAGQIYNSNAPALLAAFGCLGLPAFASHIPDQPVQIRNALTEMLESAEVVVTCGGVSVGEHDHLKDAFQECGIEQIFWRVAIKPGKPVWFGRRNKTLVFGLPGNPVSALVTMLLLVRPALLRLMGAPDDFEPFQRAELAESIFKKPGRTEFVRGTLTSQDGRLIATPTAGQGSHMLGGTGHANALIQAPAESTHLSAGSVVDVLPIKWGIG